VHNFAGADGFFVVNSPVIKGTLLFGLGFLSFCFPATAQQSSGSEQTKDEIMLEQSHRADALDTASTLALDRPEIFSTIDSLVLIQNLGLLTLLEGERLPVSSELGRMGRAPLDIFPDPSLGVAEVEKVNRVPVSAPVDGKNSPSGVTSSPLNPIYVGGEMGVLYGSSSGKFGGEILQTYIVGEVGNEKFHITVGASHEESSGRLLRFRSVEPFKR
jgi:hypothetical protein